MTRAPISRATATVLSSEPESTTTISRPRLRIAASAARSRSASFLVIRKTDKGKGKGEGEAPTSAGVKNKLDAAFFHNTLGGSSPEGTFSVIRRTHERALDRTAALAINRQAVKILALRSLGSLNARSPP